MLIRDVCGKQSGRFNSSVLRPFLYCGLFCLQHSAHTEPNITIKSWKTHDSHLVNAWTMAAPLAPALGVIFPSWVYSDLIWLKTLITPFGMGKANCFFHPWQNSFRQEPQEEKLFSVFFMKDWQKESVYASIMQISHRSSVLEENGESHPSYLSVRSDFKRRHSVYLGKSYILAQASGFYCWVVHLVEKETDEKVFMQNATFC